MDELTGEIATVADNANGLITQAQGRVGRNQHRRPDTSWPI